MLRRKTQPVGTTSDVFAEASRWRLDGSDTPCPTPDPYQVPESLPGPRRRQAEALYQNLRWLAETCGIGHVGFLTLTFGDGVRLQSEVSRRWHSLLTGQFRARYSCGVGVRERHKSGCVHLHLVVKTREDIRGAIDFRAVFPPVEALRRGVKPDYRTAPLTLRNEWEWLRGVLPEYSFGRHQLQPAKHNAEALARYVGKYISKAWTARTDDDKGVRLVNYWGHWSKLPPVARPSKPPWTARHMSLSPQARAWRECLKQIQRIARLHKITLSPESVREMCGQHWALHLTEKLKLVRFASHSGQGQCCREGIDRHNATLSDEACGVSQIHPAWWCSKKQGELIEESLRPMDEEIRRRDAEKVSLLRETLQDMESDRIWLSVIAECAAIGAARGAAVNRECAVPCVEEQD